MRWSRIRGRWVLGRGADGEHHAKAYRQCAYGTHPCLRQRLHLPARPHLRRLPGQKQRQYPSRKRNRPIRQQSTPSPETTVTPQIHALCARSGGNLMLPAPGPLPWNGSGLAPTPTETNSARAVRPKPSPELPRMRPGSMSAVRST